jgi:hypothetical protein
MWLHIIDIYCHSVQIFTHNTQNIYSPRTKVTGLLLPPAFGAVEGRWSDPANHGALDSSSDWIWGPTATPHCLSLPLNIPRPRAHRHRRQPYRRHPSPALIDLVTDEHKERATTADPGEEHDGQSVMASYTRSRPAAHPPASLLPDEAHGRPSCLPLLHVAVHGIHAWC